MRNLTALALLLAACGGAADGHTSTVVQSLTADNAQAVTLQPERTTVATTDVVVAASDTGLELGATVPLEGARATLVVDGAFSAPMALPVSVVLHLTPGAHVVALQVATDAPTALEAHAAHLSIARLATTEGAFVAR